MRRQIIQHPAGVEHYQYLLGQRFDPGAQAEIFLAPTTNPLFSFRGAGRVAGSLRVTQHPQVWVNPVVRLAGIPTIAGTMYTQPLIDPSNV